MPDDAMTVLRDLLAGADDYRCWYVPTEIRLRAAALVEAADTGGQGEDPPSECTDIACRQAECLLLVLEDARSYITPTIGTHEEISSILGWCDCGYCAHVPARAEVGGHGRADWGEET